MAKAGTIELIWADGEYPFRLGIGQLRELQDKTTCGPLELFRRLGQGTWRVDDVRETLRVALIGGGMKPDDALRLVRLYVDERPLTESVLPAQAVLMMALYGNAEDQQPGETVRRGSESGQTEGSPTPKSTVQVQ